MSGSLLYQTRFRIHEGYIVNSVEGGTIREALADAAFREWLAKEPERAAEYAHSWTEEIDVNYIRGELTVSLYPEEK